MFRTTPKPPPIATLYADLDAGLDADEYARLERTAAWLTTIITQLIQGGQSIEDIVSHLHRKYPHKFLEIQTIRAACRHAARELG